MSKLTSLFALGMLQELIPTSPTLTSRFAIGVCAPADCGAGAFNLAEAGAADAFRSAKAETPLLACVPFAWVFGAALSTEVW